MPGLRDIDERYAGVSNVLLKKYQSAAYMTPLSALQLKRTFNDNEIADLEKMMKAVRQARSSNAKMAELAKFPSTAIKLLKAVGIAL